MDNHFPSDKRVKKVRKPNQNLAWNETAEVDTTGGRNHLEANLKWRV